MTPAPAYFTWADLSPTHRLGLFSSLAFIALMAWDFSGLDPLVMQAFADSNGFYARGNWWLSQILHLRAKQFAIVMHTVPDSEGRIFAGH